MSRRLLAAAAALLPATLLVWVVVAGTAGAASAPADHTPTTPIKHFIVLMQENHTFDNYFGTYPGADGIPAGTAMPVDPSKGSTPAVAPFRIGDRSVEDLNHSDTAARTAMNGGKMDGFLAAQNAGDTSLGRLTMGYYDGRDVPYYWNMADRYVLFDHFFTSALGGSYLNHVYWVAGGLGNTTTQFASRNGLRAKTIFDRLQQAGVSWKFYVQNYDPSLNFRTSRTASQVVWCPLLNIPRFLDNKQLNSHIVDLNQYYKDLRDGTLPAVAYIVPSGSSEHPPGSLLAGQRTVRGLVNSLMTSSSWDSSAFMVSYDDWGGWYDHVLPPKRDAYGDGFRVPTLLVSPYARTHYVDHTTLDFPSILKFIEQNWNLKPLTKLDATAGSFTGAFDFNQAPRPAEIIPLERAAQTPPRSVKNLLLYSLYGISAVIAAVLVLVLWPRSRRLLTLRPAGRAQ